MICQAVNLEHEPPEPHTHTYTHKHTHTARHAYTQYNLGPNVEPWGAAQDPVEDRATRSR